MATAIVGAGVITSVEGMELSELTTNGETESSMPHGRSSNITVSIETIILSALIFIGILVWFEFIRVWFDNVFTNQPTHNFTIIWHRFWYAIFITALVLVLLYIVYRLFNPCDV